MWHPKALRVPLPKAQLGGVCGESPVPISDLLAVSAAA